MSNQSFGFRLAPVNGEEEEDDDKEQDSAVPPTADILRRTLSTNGTPAEVHLFAQLAHRVKVDKKPITTSGASGTDERPNGNGNQKKKKSGNVSSGSVSPESAVLQDEDLPLAARVAAASSALSSSTTALTSEQEKRILHLLAVKGPLTQPNIATAVKLRQDSLPTYLSTVAVLNKKSGKWDLKPESFKQVDVVGWKLYDAKERETAAKRAKEAFQSLGLSNSAPELKRISSLLSAAGGDSSASGGSSGRATPITPGEDLAPTSTSTKRKDLDAADGERERDSSSSTPPDAPHGLSMKRPRLSHTDSNDAPSPAGTADGDSKRKLPRFKRSVSAVVSSPVPTHSESPSGVGAGAGPSGWGGVSPGDAKIGESGANKSRRDKEKDKEKSERGKDKERDSKRGASTIDRYVPSTTRSRSRSVSRSRGPRSRSGSRRLRSRSRSRSRDRDRRRNRSRGRDRSRSRSRSRDRRGDRGRDSYREKEREREREKEKDRGRASGSAKGSGRESGRESGKQGWYSTIAGRTFLSNRILTFHFAVACRLGITRVNQSKPNKPASSNNNNDNIQRKPKSHHLGTRIQRPLLPIPQQAHRSPRSLETHRHDPRQFPQAKNRAREPAFRKARQGENRGDVGRRVCREGDEAGGVAGRVYQGQGRVGRVEEAVRVIGR